MRASQEKYTVRRAKLQAGAFVGTEREPVVPGTSLAYVYDYVSKSRDGAIYGIFHIVYAENGKKRWEESEAWFRNGESV